LTKRTRIKHNQKEGFRAGKTLEENLVPNGKDSFRGEGAGNRGEGDKNVPLDQKSWGTIKVKKR